MTKYMFALCINTYTYSFTAKNKAPEGLYSLNMERYIPLITGHILYQDSNQIVRIKEINELRKATDFCANSFTYNIMYANHVFMNNPGNFSKSPGNLARPSGAGR